MNLRLNIGGRIRTVALDRKDSRLEFSLDGKGVAADAVQVEPNVFSVLIGGEAFEIRTECTPAGLSVYVDGRQHLAELDDPRQWRRRAGASSGEEDHQNILAPMPGKIVRVLVEPGGTVEAGQGVLVVEAMKMQNEIKSPKRGKVERINVSDGQTVNAGEVLAVVS
jgi:biotin carboxyl carrier protein